MTDVILYEPPETPGIYDQAAAAYIEFVESKNCAPKWNELIDALYKENGKDWIDRSTLHGLLRRKEFQELLAQPRPARPHSNTGTGRPPLIPRSTHPAKLDSRSRHEPMRRYPARLRGPL